MTLAGKRAVVTGAGAGLGHAIAKAMALAGAEVAVTDLVASAAHESAADIGHGAFGLELDVSQPASVADVFAKLHTRWQGIDVLVNNAGIVSATPGREGLADRAEDWERVFDVNVFGTVRCCEAALVPMSEQGSGRIINIGSMAAHSARAIAGAYGASKAAVLRYTKGLAAEVAPKGIAINAVCPGAVWTPLQMRGAQTRTAEPARSEEELYGDFERMYSSRFPTGRPQTGDEVGHAVVFLASDLAGSVIGQCLHVDGGAILRD